MPPEERLRRDDERGPSIPGERSARRGEERSIPVAELRATHAPSEDPHLMAEHGVLELELGQTTASSERSNQPSEQEVQEGSQGPRMLPAARVMRNWVLEPHRPTLHLPPL